MKVVISSDWHADRKTAGYDRFEDIAQAARQTVDHAINVKADLWAMLGDLADPDDGPDALRAAELAIECATRLSMSGVGNIWVMGNHDVIEDGSGRSTLSPIRAVAQAVRSPERQMTWVFEGPGGFLDRGVSVVVLPYSPASKPYDIAAYARERAEHDLPHVGARGLVLAHATHVIGAKQGEETLEMPRGRAVVLPIEEFPLGWTVVNGHFHTPQVTDSGVIIPGALARLTFGEEHNKPRFLTLEI